MQQLVGRNTEVGELVRRLESAVSGVGSAAVFVGEAGVGKSALLDEVGRLGADRMTVLRASGVEDEMGFAWSGLASLIRPLIGTEDYAALPAGRRRVLDTSLFLADDPVGDAEIEPYSLSLALVDLVTTAALRRPLLLLVDDLHWVDPASARALAYVGRRLEREYVALVATSRPSTATAGLGAVALEPPPVADADAILRQRGVGSSAVRAALIAAVGTNPLMLLNTVGELSGDVLRGSLPFPDPLPFRGTLMDGAARRLAQLDAATREALSAIAVLGQPTSLDVQRMLAALGADEAVLEAAEVAGILDVGDVIRFTHPTLRTAAHRSTSAPDRRRVHRLAAEVVSHDPVARAMHLAAASSGPSNEVAALLETAAEQLVQRGATALAAEQFRRAAHLSEDIEAASARRLRAGELHLDLGLIDQARAVLGPLESAGDDPSFARAWARLLHLEERDEEACALLRKTAAAITAAAPNDAARLLIECLAPLVREARLGELFEVVGELEAIRTRIDGGLARRVDATVSVFAMLGGSSRLDVMATIDALIADEGVVRAAPFLAEVIAPALAYARRDEALGAILDTVERALRDRAAIVPLISVLAAQQLRYFGVRQPLAIDAGEEAIRLADEIGRPKLAMMAAFGLSIGASAASDAVAYGKASDLLRTSTYANARGARLVGLGVLHLSAGRSEQALEAWTELIAGDGFGNPLLTFEADYLETLMRLGRAEEARVLLTEFDDIGITARSPALLGRVRAMLADDDDEAAALFEQAIAMFRFANNRIGEGRAELVWGERLRRKRRRAEARVHLERARRLFRTVGVPGWTARADAELAASGAAVDPALPVHALLSAQELRVARLAAGGASNREIGVDLFVSERTVETHLTTIFRKLQIKNRKELAARSVVDADLRAPDA